MPQPIGPVGWGYLALCPTRTAVGWASRASSPAPPAPVPITSWIKVENPTEQW